MSCYSGNVFSNYRVYENNNNVEGNPRDRAPCQNRSRHFQRSIFLHLRRWIVEFWRTILKRVKSAFSVKRVNVHRRSSRSMDANVSSTVRTFDNNPERKNTLSREDSEQKTIKNARQDALYEQSLYQPYNSRLRSPQTIARRRSQCAQHNAYRTRCVNDESSKRYSDAAKGLADSRTVTTDEEYQALYRKCSESVTKGRCNNPAGDSIDVVEEAGNQSNSRLKWGSRYSLGDSGKLEARACAELLRCVQSSSLSSGGDWQRQGDEERGRWVQTVCFGNVWYSKSQVNARNRKRKVRTSRIPRLRKSPRARHEL